MLGSNIRLKLVPSILMHLLASEPYSKLPVSPSIIPIILPYITPFRSSDIAHLTLPLDLCNSGLAVTGPMPMPTHRDTTSSMRHAPRLPYDLKSKLLRGGHIGDPVGEYYRGYERGC